MPRKARIDALGALHHIIVSLLVAQGREIALKYNYGISNL
jgi:hypothetical protein